MKFRILFVLLLVGCLPFTVSGQKLTANQFYKNFQTITNSDSYKSADNAKDYAQLADFYVKLIGMYNQVDDKEKPSLKSLMGNGIYYNAACYYSRLKKKKQALEYLKKSIDFGFKDIEHIKADSDLDNIRHEKKFKEIIKQLENCSYLNILKRSGGFAKEEKAIPQFTYANPNDSNSVKVRRYFNLDSIAGSGDEISKIKNLMYWVHNTIRHDGSSENPKEKNAIALAELCKKENRGINCRMMAIMLNECYMAMGWKSRYITCLPQDSTDNDCHVINAVFSNTLNKWIWMDPTFAAYVSDEKGNLLGLSEVRERLVKGLPLVLNDDANWNNKNKETKAMYLDSYMAKNLYQLECPIEFRFGEESKGGKWSKYILLKPHGYDSFRARHTEYITEDENQFWQTPY